MLLPIRSIIRGVLVNDEGASMVEYAILVSLIAAVCIAVVTTLGHTVSNQFSSMNASL
jgi:Flp pilus assembly pilin Flp